MKSDHLFADPKWLVKNIVCHQVSSCPTIPFSLKQKKSRKDVAIFLNLGAEDKDGEKYRWFNDDLIFRLGRKIFERKIFVTRTASFHHSRISLSRQYDFGCESPSDIDQIHFFPQLTFLACALCLLCLGFDVQPVQLTLVFWSSAILSGNAIRSTHRAGAGSQTRSQLYCEILWFATVMSII